MPEPSDPLHSSNRDLASAERRRSVLHEGNTLKGEWVTDAIIELGGTFVGDLKADTLVLTRTGHIDGTITARSVMIEGSLRGTVSAQSVTIKSSATVAANIGSQTLVVESGAAIQLTHKLAGQDDWLVEVGDLGAIRARGGRPFVAGPHLNTYHGDTLRWLASLGACRFVAPLELNRTDLAALLAETPPSLQCEVMVWGRMPLAFSARCFTARHFDLSKDDCAFRCIEHPDGLAMRTQEDGEFLTLNGMQTQSGAVLDLLNQATELGRMGVAALRVSPQSHGTLDAIAALAATRAGQPLPSVTLPAGIGRCNGYWWGESGNVWHGG